MICPHCDKDRGTIAGVYECIKRHLAQIRKENEQANDDDQNCVEPHMMARHTKGETNGHIRGLERS